MKFVKLLCTYPQTVCVNNQGAMFIAKNHVTSERSKHIDIKYFLKDLVHDKIIKFEYVPSHEKNADLMIKQMSKKTVHKLNSRMC